MSLGQTLAAAHEGEITLYIRNALENVVCRIEKDAKGTILTIPVGQ